MEQPALERRLGTADAVVIGLGSMIGAGVFSAFGPAARAAGAGLLIGLVLAAVIAYCNATASAQLAAVYPTSGGTYIYGRERLGPWWGFLAGWGFVIGKTASCAAMALTFASYAIPGPGTPQWLQRIAAIAAVVALSALNYRGVTKTAVLARILVACTLIALTAFVVGIALAKPSQLSLGVWPTASLYGVLQSAGLLFFAFAGYARIATMGEEVRDPARTIPRAITLALVIAVAVYLVVGVAALLAAGPDRLAHAAAPLTEAVRAVGATALVPVLAAGGALASLGALLALIAGLGRTTLAMARNRDLPPGCRCAPAPPRTPPRRDRARCGGLCFGGHRRPARSDRLLVVRGADLLRDRQRGRLHAARSRALGRVRDVCGVAGCLLLVATLPWQSAVAGLGMFAIGIAGRAAGES